MSSGNRENRRRCEVFRAGRWVALADGLGSSHVGDLVRMFEPDGELSCEPFKVCTEPVSDGIGGWTVMTDPEIKVEVPSAQGKQADAR